MIDIFKTIREERDDFINNEIEVVPGYTFSQYETIKKIHLYSNGHYVDGDYEEVNGVTRKKNWEDTSNWRVEVAANKLDVDVKDFRLIGTNPDQDMQVVLLEKELKVWMKKHELGRILNEIVRKLPRYGSVVIEKVKDGVQIVDLRYLYNDQAADCLDNSRYINIKNYMSVGELRKMAGKWENVDDAIDQFQAKYAPHYDTSQGTTTVSKPEGSPYVEVWKRYGEVPLSWFTNKQKDENEYTLARYVVCGVDNVTKDAEGRVTNENGIILYKEELEELPLKEVHYNKTEGRWLAVGVIEALFEPQRRRNEVANQEARAMELGSLQLFQSMDPTVASNITTDLDNGQIMKVKSPITRIETEMRDTAAFQIARENGDKLGDRITSTYDAIRGEKSASQTTLGEVQLQNANASSIFDFKREDIILFLNEYIKDIVYPTLRKEFNKAHILRIVGDMEDLKRFRKNWAKNYARKEWIDGILAGNPLTDQDHELFRKKAEDTLFARGDKEWIDIFDDYFKNLDYEVDLASNENTDLQSQSQNVQAALATLKADPTILQDPVKRRLFFLMLTAVGIHISELEDLENEASQQPQPSPMQPGQPLPANPLPNAPALQ